MAALLSRRFILVSALSATSALPTSGVVHAESFKTKVPDGMSVMHDSTGCPASCKVDTVVPGGAHPLAMYGGPNCDGGSLMRAEWMPALRSLSSAWASEFSSDATCRCSARKKMKSEIL